MRILQVVSTVEDRNIRSQRIEHLMNTPDRQYTVIYGHNRCNLELVSLDEVIACPLRKANAVCSVQLIKVY